MFKGVVTQTSSFPFQSKVLYSFQLQGVRAFFRTGEKEPGLIKGDYVEFDAKGPDAKGNYNVDVSTLSKKAGDSAQAASGPTGFRKAFTSQPNRDFPTKDERAETQARIEIQSVRNSALQFIEILLSQDAIKFGPKVDKVEVLESLLEHYMTEFLERNKGKTGTQSDLASKESGQSSSSDTDIL